MEQVHERFCGVVRVEGTVAGGGVEEGENVDDCEWLERSDDGFGKTVSRRSSVQNCLMLL